MVTLGEQLKQLRKERKMTQATLAEHLGVSIAAISAYENNSRLPSYDKLLQIAKVFCVSIDWLLDKRDKSISTIDVTGLTQTQINTIQDIVKTYQEYNVLANRS